MGCGGSKDQDVTLVSVETAGQSPKSTATPAATADSTASAGAATEASAGAAAGAAGGAGDKRYSERKRRRVAVASETTEMLATVRWQSAFDAIRKEEFKLPQHVIKLKETLLAHPIMGSMEPMLIDQIVNAMRVQKVKEGTIVIKQGDAGDAFYIVGEGSLAAYVRARPLRHEPRPAPRVDRSRETAPPAPDRPPRASAHRTSASPLSLRGVCVCSWAM